MRSPPKSGRSNRSYGGLIVLLRLTISKFMKLRYFLRKVAKNDTLRNVLLTFVRLTETPHLRGFII